MLLTKILDNRNKSDISKLLWNVLATQNDDINWLRCLLFKVSTELGDGKQKDQHEMLTLLLQRLLVEKIIPEGVIHSIRASRIQCPSCSYEAAADVCSDPLIIARVSPNEKERDMADLIEKVLSGPDANCPNCEKNGETIQMYRSTDPRHIGYPDILLVTIGR